MLPLLKNIFRNLGRKPATRLYPVERRAPPEGTRGHIEMDPDVCIYCGICQKRCPAGAIAVSREPKRWTLNPYACVICGYCVDVCPKKCIRMQPDHLPPA